MIISRYLNRDILITTAVTTLILLAIFISNQFVRYLGDAAIGRVTATAVLQLMLIQVPLLSGFMLPLGYFIAILLSYGRLYNDSEMTILFASGVSRLRLLGMTLVGASVVTVLVATLMLWVEPEMAWYRDHILARAAAASPLEKIAPGRFHVIGHRWVFFVNQLSRDRGSMAGVFAAEIPQVAEKNQTKATVLFADKATQVTGKEQQNFIEFQRGARYIGNPGDKDYQVVQFDKYGVAIPERPIHMSKLEEFTSTRELWAERKTNRLAAAELQWRLSMPLSVLILTLFAIPLSRVLPRQGRFARFIPAIIIYTVYIDLLFVSQSWVQKGIVGTAIGMWWVHVLMFLLGAGVCGYHIGPTELTRWMKR